MSDLESGKIKAVTRAVTEMRESLRTFVEKRPELRKSSELRISLPHSESNAPKLEQLANYLSKHIAPRVGFTASKKKNIAEARLREFLLNTADGHLTELEVKGRAALHFKSVHIPRALWRECWAALPAQQKRGLGAPRKQPK